MRQVNASIENPVICHAAYVNTRRSNSIAGRRLARVRPCRWALSLPRHLRLLRSARAHAGAAGHAPRNHALAGRAARSLNAAGSHRRGQVDPALRLSRQPEHSRPGRCSLKRSWCRLPASSAPTSSAIASPAGRAHSQQDGLEDGSQEPVGVLLLRIRNSHKRMAEREAVKPRAVPCFPPECFSVRQLIRHTTSGTAHHHRPHRLPTAPHSTSLCLIA